MEREILEATATLVTALEHGDAAAASAVYAEDARLLAPAGELVRGRDQIEGYWRAGIALGLTTVRFESRLLETVGGSAVELGRYGLSVDVERADTAVELGTYVVLHKQVADGSWRRALDAFEPDEPSPARRQPHVRRSRT